MNVASPDFALPATGVLNPSCALEAGFNRFARGLAECSALLIGLLLLPICVDVSARYFFHVAIPGVMEIETLTLVLIAFAAMPYTFVLRQPIQIDIFFDMFSPKTQTRLLFFSHVLCAAVCAVLAWETLGAGREWNALSTVLYIPEQYFVLFTSFSFAVIFVALLFQIRHSAAALIARRDRIGFFAALLAVALLALLPVAYKSFGLRLSGLLVGGVGFGLLFALLLLRVPIGFAMAVMGLLGLLVLTRRPVAAFSVLGDIPFRHTADFVFVALPMFMLMGELTSQSGLSKDLFDCANKWLGRMPGGLAVASVGGCAGFGAICGDSLACVITMTSVALPQMRERRYDMALATGSLAAGGTLGILIPPSMGFIFYSIMTEESIGKLFIAGIIPGIVLTLIFCAIIMIRVRRRPELAPLSPAVSLGEKLRSLVHILPIVLLFVLVVGGILAGAFTPGEGGAVGAMGALLYATARRRLTLAKLHKALYATAVMCGKFFMIFSGVYVFGAFLASSSLPNLLAQSIVEMQVNRYVILAAVVVIYIMLGCVMNIGPMMLLTLPSIYPTIIALGFDGIWFGVVTVVLMEMGMITPPVGLNVFTLSSMAPDIPMIRIFRGVLPFVLGMLLCVVILTLFPALATFLPDLLI